MRSILFFIFFIAAGPVLAQQQVLTYHYDNQRTGWNQNETILTPANVPGLRLLASVPLDDEVVAQPLVYNGIIYVVTKNNSVYSIDASGNILTQQNLGPPIGNFGILSTPVIDPTSSTLYVMVYFDANNDLNNQLPTYQLHALDANSLTDKVTPVTVSASGRLTNGSTYQFDASVTEQRPALLLSTNGNIYAGFGAFYDSNPNAARGWLLSWQGGSLTPLPNNYLANRLANDIDDIFLTSIWSSGGVLVLPDGYVVAAGKTGEMYLLQQGNLGGNAPKNYVARARLCFTRGGYRARGVSRKFGLRIVSSVPRISAYLTGSGSG